MNSKYQHLHSHPLPIFILKIALPQTLTLSFEKTFSVDPLSEPEFKKISDLRNEVVVASSRQFAEAAINGVNKYLPCLFGLIQAVEKLPPEFCKYLGISWTSSALYEGKYHTTHLRHHDWNFEVISVLSTYALLHRKLALEKLSSIPDEDFDNNCQEPTKLLREAAGIFEFIATNFSSKFFPDLNYYPIPEMVSDTFLILSDISQAESQSIVLKKAILTSKSASILAKLCAGIASLYDHAHNLLEQLKKGKPKQFNFNPSVSSYIYLSKELYTSLTYKFIGISVTSTGQPGQGVAYLIKARNIIQNTSFTPQPKLSMDSDISQFWTKFEEERNLIITLATEFEHDNYEIYHEKVPNETSLPPPEIKLMSTPIQFQPPSPMPINVIPSKGGYCVIL